MMRHRQIEQKNIRLNLTRQFHRLKAIASFANDFHVGFRFQKAS